MVFGFVPLGESSIATWEWVNTGKLTREEGHVFGLCLGRWDPFCFCRLTLSCGFILFGVGVLGLLFCSDSFELEFGWWLPCSFGALLWDVCHFLLVLLGGFALLWRLSILVQLERCS